MTKCLGKIKYKTDLNMNLLLVVLINNFYSLVGAKTFPGVRCDFRTVSLAKDDLVLACMNALYGPLYTDDSKLLVADGVFCVE